MKKAIIFTIGLLALCVLFCSCGNKTNEHQPVSSTNDTDSVSEQSNNSNSDNTDSSTVSSTHTTSSETEGTKATASTTNSATEEQYNKLCDYLNQYENSTNTSGLVHIDELGKSLKDDELYIYLETAFTALGHYKDCKEKLIELADCKKEKRYITLCDYLKKYEFPDNAYGYVYISELDTSINGDELYNYLETAFKELGDYKDCKEQLKNLPDCKKRVEYTNLCNYFSKYQSSSPSAYISELGKSLKGDELYNYLETGFQELGDYKDCKEQLKKLADCKNEKKYTKLCDYFSKYQSSSPSVYISELGKSLKGDELYNYLETGFQELGDYKDCKEQLKKLADNKYEMINYKYEETYVKLCDYLNELKTKGSVYISEIQKKAYAGTLFTYGEVDNAIEYIINGFAELGNYKDSAEILSRFTVYKNKLLNITQSNTDKLGNVRESTTSTAYYVTGEEAIEVQTKWGIYYDGSVCYLLTDKNIETVEYDNKNRLSCIKLLSNFGEIAVIVTFKYDINDNIAAITYETLKHTRESVYTYDQNQCLISATINPVGIGPVATLIPSYIYHHEYDKNGNLLSIRWHDKDYAADQPSMVYTYTYDKNGNILKEIQTDYSYTRDIDKNISLDSKTVTSETEYMYNNQGHLIQKKITDFYYDGTVSSTHTFKYTNDALGNPISAESEYVTSSQTISYKYTYTYGDVYFYTPKK